MQIVIYTKSGCPNCVTAKRLLDSKGIGYNAINLETDAEQELFFINHPMARQFPYILIEGQRVGGLA
jgi:glutaredoxin 3